MTTKKQFSPRHKVMLPPSFVMKNIKRLFTAYKLSRVDFDEWQVVENQLRLILTFSNDLDKLTMIIKIRDRLPTSPRWMFNESLLRMDLNSCLFITTPRFSPLVNKS